MKPGPPGRLPVGGQQAADDDPAPRRRPGQLQEAWPGGGRGRLRSAEDCVPSLKPRTTDGRDTVGYYFLPGKMLHESIATKDIRTTMDMGEEGRHSEGRLGGRAAGEREIGSRPISLSHGDGDGETERHTRPERGAKAAALAAGGRRAHPAAVGGGRRRRGGPRGGRGRRQTARAPAARSAEQLGARAIHKEF